MLIKLRAQETAREYSFAGIQLGGARVTILARHLAYNETLGTLHLVRKNIQDNEGCDLAKMLLTNSVLRKLELEGNCLGAKTAKELGFALQHNMTLKSLDLESNQLSPQDNTDSSGIMRFIEGLRVNQSLLSLNISNNQLGPEIGQQFRVCLEKNHTLIDFEFGNNAFRLDDVRKI